MVDKVSRDLSFKLKHLTFLLPVFVAVLIALGISQLSVSVEVSPAVTVPFLLEENGIKEVFINVTFFVGVALLNALLSRFILAKGWVSLLEKIFGFSGGVLTLFFAGVLSTGILQLWRSLFSFVVIYMLIFLIGISIALLIANVFSEEMKNMLFLIYGSVTGCFLGVGIPVFSMILILISLCVIDALFVESGLIKSITDLPYEERISVKVRYSTIEYEIGLGDILYYSMLTSHSMINFGASTAIYSALLILAGCILTVACTTRNAIAGLPIPIGLGVIPMILQLDLLL